MNQINYEVESEKDFRHLFNLARDYIQKFGIDSHKNANTILALSEIVTNAIRYCGYAKVSLAMTENEKGIEIVVEDNGPGIANISEAMKDGFSTFSSASLGMGLGAAKRCVDDLLIDSSSAGTKVTLRTYLSGSFSMADVGVVSYPKSGEVVNGDRYLIKDYEGDKLLVAIIDGSGHGEKAHISSSLALKVVEEYYKQPIEEIFAKIHKTLCGREKLTCAEMAIARITDSSLEYSSLGNVSGSILSQPKLSFKVNNGRLGMALPDILQVNRYKRPDDFTLVLYSDGITTPVDLKEISSDRTAQNTAEFLFNQHASPSDDASIIVLRG
ncbi:MAG: ATP-binding protein [Candidatus Thiodiazotropha taylori]|nr:ATP-binding protein [Candidatus Thiodiazotropha taylori]